MEWRIPYLGIVFCDFHHESFKRRLVQLVFQQGLNPKSSLHVPALQKLMTPIPTPATTPTPAPTTAGKNTIIDDDDDEVDDEPAPVAPKKKAKVGSGGSSTIRQSLLQQLTGAGDDGEGAFEPVAGED